METILIPAEQVKVAAEADVCVIGGSCTGVFAAVRAARLGARVILVEKQNRLGGTASCGLVSMWHSVFDATGTRQVIGGLTFEMMERLERCGGIGNFRTPAEFNIRLNSELLTLELDALVEEHPNIRLFLQTSFSRAVMRAPGEVEAVIAENNAGRFAIRAGAFIDASGDGVLCRAAGCAMHRPERFQPPTSCARFEGWKTLGDFNLTAMVEKFRDKYPELPCGYWWGMEVPNSSCYMLAGTRVLHYDPEEADATTRAELDSRRQLRAILEMIRNECRPNRVSLQALPSAVGIREGLHIESRARLKGEEMLAGTAFPDAIGNGTYPVDIHSDGDDSISFRRLNGEAVTYRGGQPVCRSRWLPEGEVLPFYRFTLGSLMPEGMRNLIAAGRMLDADRDAFGAVRVMVNLNQCGEAAGVAATQALEHGADFTKTDCRRIRELLASGGSIML